MASPNKPRPWRPLAFIFAAVVAMYAAIFLGLSSHTPALGLDLRGGTSVTLTPKLQAGKKVSSGQLSKAVDIIRQRVNGLGVSEADVTTEGTNIVVSVPGKGRQDVINLVGTTAELRFRRVVTTAAGTSSIPPTPTPSSSKSSSAHPTPKPSATGSVKAKPAPTPTSNGRPLSRALVAASATPTARATPTTHATPSAAAPSPSPTASPPSLALETQFAALDCSKDPNPSRGLDNPNQQIIACSQDKTTKYLLDVAKVIGTDVHGAQATLDAQTGTSWIVNVSFTSKGQSRFTSLTKQTVGQQVAIVLDGVVVSAPTIQEAIPGSAQISGSFTEKSAKDLANVLKYGALPVSFTIPTSQSISPTLGTAQLHAGLLAGAIGLILVIAYSLLYYRGLGLVTVASLALSALLLYAATTLLGHLLGYTLSLAGIAGFIVAVGITADSFVVFFERLRDEVREGRTLRSGVEKAWKRAFRTILSADFVSLLAAVVLYLVSIGNVRGFAFTLGLSTASDLLIVTMFTKPLLTMLARTKLYGTGTRFSGLNPERLGVRRRTRAEEVADVTAR